MAVWWVQSMTKWRFTQKLEILRASMQCLAMGSFFYYFPIAPLHCNLAARPPGSHGRRKKRENYVQTWKLCHFQTTLCLYESRQVKGCCCYWFPIQSKNTTFSFAHMKGKSCCSSLKGKIRKEMHQAWRRERERAPFNCLESSWSLFVTCLPLV